MGWRTASRARVGTPLPRGRLPRRVEAASQHGVEERSDRVDDVVEGPPGQLVVARHGGVGQAPGLQRRGNPQRASVSLAKREGLLDGPSEARGVDRPCRRQQREVRQILHSRVRPISRQRVSVKLLSDVRHDGVEPDLGRRDAGKGQDVCGERCLG